ncbi:GNAT family N-acetyltransferase [Streptomyces sp. N2A]|uniref:GNAT family N-acetyltransferase n=1 Tax=Streptomyces sp. N2A TaxID=3073936 RepID=UPI00286FDAB2|nr:GNAT family N-acetyltransferase [Streptomyces sp. N2A]
MDATTTAPALLLRPWRSVDVPALVEACRDPVLRQWTSVRVSDEADGLRWVESQREGWTTGDRFAFAVLEATWPCRTATLMGHVVVLKGVARGKPSAEVGYWTAAHARGLPGRGRRTSRLLPPVRPARRARCDPRRAGLRRPV